MCHDSIVTENMPFLKEQKNMRNWLDIENGKNTLLNNRNDQSSGSKCISFDMFVFVKKSLVVKASATSIDLGDCL